MSRNLILSDLENYAIFICGEHLLVKKSETLAMSSDGKREFDLPKDAPVFLMTHLKGVDHNGVNFEFGEVPE